MHGARIGRLLVATAVALVAMAALATTAMASHVTPRFIAGNDELRDCENAAAQAGLSGSWTGLKIDGQPANQSYTSGPLTVTISNVTSTSFDWSSNIGLGAVFVKAGNGANLYEYNNETSDTGLQTPAGHGISHLLFCYRVALVVSKTASPAYKLTHTWDVEKMANPTSQTVNVGSSGGTTWTVVLDENSTKSDWAVSGTITVTNPASIATMVSLSDSLPGATVSLEPGCSSFMLAAGASVECDYTATYTSDPGTGTLTNTATADAAAEGIGDGSGSASFSFANATVTEVNKEVDLSDDLAPGGTFSNPYTGDATETYPATYPCTEPGTRTIPNTAIVSPHGSESVLDQDTATFTLTCQQQTTPPPPAVPTPITNLSINKVDTPDPAALNGTVTYVISVVNTTTVGASNVVVNDPIPGAMTYTSATPSQGTCTGGQSLSCSLGSLAGGASATITVTVTATQAGTFTNTATVTTTTPETSTADNTASTDTTVRAPLTPPTPKPKPKPKPKPVVCYAFTVSAKTVPAGQGRTLVVRVKRGGNAVKGAKVLVRGAGISRSARTNAKGVARIRITAKRPGILRISVASKASCTSKRVGVVGAFEPPVTG